MFLSDAFLSREICDCPRHFENPAVRACRHAEFVDHHLKQFLPRFVEGAELADMPGGHSGVGVKAIRGQPLPLDRAGLFYPGADGC